MCLEKQEVWHREFYSRETRKPLPMLCPYLNIIRERKKGKMRERSSFPLPITVA